MDTVDHSTLYYTLRPHFDQGIIYAPVCGNTVPARKVLTKSKVNRLIDSIPDMSVSVFYSGSANELVRHYKDYITTNDCGDLIELSMSIYAKKQGGKFGAIDKKFMKQAEYLLFGEFATALEISPEDIPAYIENRIEGRK
jgi:CarD family transcriptional regulator